MHEYKIFIVDFVQLHVTSHKRKAHVFHPHLFMAKDLLIACYHNFNKKLHVEYEREMQTIQ